MILSLETVDKLWYATLSQVDFSCLTHVMVGAVTVNTDGSIDSSFFIDPTNGPLWAKDTVQRAHAAGTYWTLLKSPYLLLLQLFVHSCY